MPVSDHKVSIRVICDTQSIQQLAREWNALVGISCKNPFLLSDFVKEFIESNHKTWTPLVLVISFKGLMIGIAPLVIKKKIGIRTVKFSNPLWCSDFIINEQFREICVSNIVHFVFKTLNCKFAEFTLSCDSPNFEALLQQCNFCGINVKVSPEMGRKILPISCKWSEFEAGLDKRFRKKMKKSEHKLDSAGSWKLVCASGKEQPEAIKKLFEVEENCWKAKWRAQRGEHKDNDIMVVLQASQQMSEEPEFDWNIWYLELNGKTLSYMLTLEYDDVVFFVKTSFDEQYNSFQPGLVLHNALIREMFNTGRKKRIDFISDMKYLNAWTDKCVPRVKISLTNGLVSTVFHSISENAVVKKIFHNLF